MRRLKLVALVAPTMALMLTASPSHAQFGIVVGRPPPPPMWQPMPPAPFPGSVWQPGFWNWNGVQYVWVPGVYARPPVPGQVWVSGRWVPRGAGWYWSGGYWRGPPRRRRW